MRSTINKPFVILMVIAIVVIALVSVGPTVYTLATSTGVKAEALDIDDARPASTDLDGTWKIVPGSGRNSTQVGFTFHEVLPGTRKATSGSTYAVDGTVVVANERLQSADLVVDATSLRTDVKKRDINVAMKILHTDTYPTAEFHTTEPVDLSALPEDGTPAEVTIPGELTLHGVTHTVEPVFTVVRTGKRVLMYSTLPVNRLDYNVKTPEFVAATIAEEGELNIRLDMEKVAQ
ncbi:YceI family protein [Corynebacterium choanae]|uniref:YceI-like domain protein n=1 Tax=Corynebacterium choanae TaxID=1862358 RepID=A0A3G6JAN6_9CORY|nr:YceI family protein [Corynebacterium choanae]AZA13540.1 YceI-like domain protein [Corynebacterium choanae]